MITFGIDSSNYRSSAAAILKDGYISKRQLLPVPMGERGLRQSDAVFAHTKQLPGIVSDVLSQVNVNDIAAIGVSNKPRRLEDSYMPCFLTGVGLAEVLSKALSVPLFNFSHQEGHIAAALYSAGRMDLIGSKFIAFHVSGGTTEALLVTPSDIGFKTQIIAKTLDLNLGQVIDRAGVMLGLPFPAGEKLEKLAQNGVYKKSLKPCIKGCDCALSGVENTCQKLLNQNETREDIAAFVLNFAADTLCQMTLAIKNEYGDLPFVYSGGVMADEIIKNKLKSVVNADFASIELSGDNAVGIALLAKLQMEK